MLSPSVSTSRESVPIICSSSSVRPSLSSSGSIQSEIPSLSVSIGDSNGFKGSVPH